MTARDKVLSDSRHSNSYMLSMIFGRSVMASALAACVISVNPGQASSDDIPRTFDPANYVETFSETFRDRLDVTAHGPSRWTAHTPWNGDFGDAIFTNPVPGFPFETGPEGLKITARKSQDGRWRSGLLSSVNAQRQGFSQALGYFEARIRMPPGPGNWPAFWLVSHADPDFDAEIDVVEYYGHATSAYQITAQLWPKSPAFKHTYYLQAIHVPSDTLVERFHQYGVEITKDLVIFYLDRKEVARVATEPAMRQPMSLLIDLALGSGWPIDKTPDPSILAVDYIKVFKSRSSPTGD